MIKPIEVQWYDHNKGLLVHPWKHKIRKILQFDCLHRLDTRRWECRPIEGYNTRTYTLEGEHLWKCNCQGFKKRNDCSHRQALLLVLDRIGYKDPDLFGITIP